VTAATIRPRPVRALRRSAPTTTRATANCRDLLKAAATLAARVTSIIILVQPRIHCRSQKTRRTTISSSRQ